MMKWSETSREREDQRKLALDIAKRHLPNSDHIEVHPYGGDWYAEVRQGGETYIYGIYGERLM